MDKLLWLDLETTGLDPTDDLILEVAAIVTVGFEVAARFYVVTDAAHDISTRDVDPIVLKMHEDNGLWMESLRHGQEYDRVGAQLKCFVQDHAPKAQLAGSSVHFDRAFLASSWPEVVDELHYRQLDVTAFNEAARRWWPAIYAARPQGESRHRAMDDVLASIATMRYYVESLAK